MAISPDAMSGNTSAVLERAPQSLQKMSEIRRGNWLLNLEREQISSQSRYQSPDTQPSNGANRSMSDGVAGNDMAAQRKLQGLPAQTVLSWPQPALATAHTGPSVVPAALASYPPQAEVKSVASALVVDSGLNNVSNRVALKDVPSLKSHRTIAEDLRGAVEPELMTPDATKVAAIGAEDAGAPGDYSLRQIHLYSQDGKVQAWIRDTQLDEKRSSAIETALRTDLKKSGWELVGLTINGKKMASLLQQSQQRFQSLSVNNAQ